MVAITGASGNTGSKLAKKLLLMGEKVRVIGRSEKNLKSLKEKGAEVWVGDQSDVAFLTKAFTGCDVAYLLIPPKFDAENVRAYYNHMGDLAIEAVKKSGLKKLVFLSSLGAEQEYGTGPVIGLHDVELKLKALKNVDIVFLRPGYFMENTLGNVQLIKSQHINGNPTRPDAPVYMIATKDIAEKAAEILHKRNFTGHSVVDLYGQKISYAEATRIIGERIGEPQLPYIQFPDKQALEALEQMGLSESVASSFVELAQAINEGRVHVTQLKTDTPTSPTTYNQFVEEVFYPAYTAS